MKQPVEETLESLKIEVLKEDGDERWALCPGHKKRTGHEDHDPSWSINVRTGAHYCLGGETLVGTKEGRVPIQDLVGKTTLLTSHGWTDCEVQYFGEQPLWEVTLQRNGVQKIVRATPEHRWFSGGLSGQQRLERTTQELRPGHLLLSTTPPLVTKDLDPEGVRRGIIFGDGTRYGDKSKSRITVYTSEKQRLIDQWFPHSHGHPGEWKSLPSIEETPELLLGWLAGYFAADGCVDTNGMPSLSSAFREHLEFVKDVCWKLGMVAYTITEQVRDVTPSSGYTYNDHSIFQIKFDRASFPETFYLREKHISRKKPAAYARLRWRVMSVTPTSNVGPVYCAVVPNHHEFVLDDYVLTGNCFSCHWKGNLYTLVRELRGKLAADVLISETKEFGRPVSTSREVPRPPSTWSSADRFTVRESLPKSWLSVYDLPPKWALNARRLSLQSAIDYGVRWDPKREAWILPLYTPDLTRLVGFQIKGERSRFFRNQPRAMEKSTTLFGLGTAKGDVVVVESPLDAVLLYRLGYNAVAICGSRVSDDQLHLLRQYDQVTYALDNDSAGQREHKRLSLLDQSGPARFVHYTGPWKDVGDMPDDDAIRTALDSCRPTASSGVR